MLLQVQIEIAFPGGFIQFEQRAPTRGADDIHHAVKARQGVSRLGDAARRVLGDGDVGAEGRGFDPQRADLRRHSIAARFFGVQHCDIGAGFCQGQRGGTANTLAAAHHQRLLSCQVQKKFSSNWRLPCSQPL